MSLLTHPIFLVCNYLNDQKHIYQSSKQYIIWFWICCVFLRRMIVCVDTGLCRRAIDWHVIYFWIWYIFSYPWTQFWNSNTPCFSLQFTINTTNTVITEHFLPRKIKRVRKAKKERRAKWEMVPQLKHSFCGFPLQWYFGHHKMWSCVIKVICGLKIKKVEI